MPNEERCGNDGFLAGNQTKRHPWPIVYRVHELMVSHQGQYFTVKWLCNHYWGKYTKSLDTLMRTVVEIGVNDRMMQGLIISTRKGYLHPTPEQVLRDKLVKRSMDELDKAGRALFYRRGSIKYKLEHEGQYKMALGKNDSPVFEAFIHENDAIVGAELEAELQKQAAAAAKGKIRRKNIELMDADPDADVILPNVGEQAQLRLDN
jgi:hypothetical protein